MRPWPAPRLPAVLATAALLLCWFGAGVGRAAVIAPYPGIAYPGGAYNSRCAPITLGPQVVEIGQTITEHAGPATDECDSLPKDISWSWAVGGQPVSGCKPRDSTCVVKEESPTDTGSDGGPSATYHWAQDCIDGSSGFGAWSSCALYVVLDHQFEVSGTVTAPGTDDGVPDVKVQADCPHGGTATTDAAGDYRFALDRGQCTITVVPPHGESASPSSRVVDVEHDISHVDFQVGCGASEGAHLATAADAGGADCKLNVKVKTFGPGTTGLGWVPNAAGDGFEGEFLSPLSADDTAGSTGQPAGKCLSGCVNVRIVVTDAKTGEAVEGATVAAGVTPLPGAKIAPYPKGFQADDGRLCLATDPSTCGAKLQGLTTNAVGEVDLLYWAPGVTDGDTVKLTVTAEDTCSPTVCHTTRQFGKGHAAIDVLPQKIVDAAGTLDHEQTSALVEWADADGFISKLLDGGKEEAAKKVLEQALEWGGKAFEVEIPGGLILAGGSLLQSTAPTVAPLSTALGQEQAVTSLLAEPFGLHTDGLGSVQALALDPGFVKAISGDGSLMRKFAAFVKDEYEHKGGGFEYRTHLIIDEVSYCQHGQACGPGQNTPGIQPFLDIRFEATGPSSSNKNETYFEDSAVVPYFAALFDVAQFGGHAPPLLH
jgi:hypothetical protein